MIPSKQTNKIIKCLPWRYFFMSRKNKYTKEFKMKCVKRILSGQDTIYSLAYKYHIHQNIFYEWIIRQKIFGEEAFNDHTRNISYSKELKEACIKDYLSGNYTTYDLQLKYKISSDSIVRRWINMYNKGKEIKDYNPQKEAYTMKARETTLKERIEIVQYVLSHENDYKGAAIKYVVPYASIYNWVKKYEKNGIEGLSDHRGRPSQNEQKHKVLTKEEEQDILIKKLQNELEYKDKVIEVLKKKNEIMDEMERDSHQLDKSIYI